MLATTIDGVSGEGDITKLWHDHYSTLLNSNKCTKSKNDVLKVINEPLNLACVPFSVGEVATAIEMLKTGKSPGLDNVQAEHFKFADTRLICLLSMLFNSIVSHGYMPQNLMKSVIVPIIKDKRGQVTDRNNYRPIAITSVSSKILELLILERYSDALSTTHNQFGFKEAHGTDLCIFTLKQVIEFYRLQGSPVYICYLDAYKEFDRINH